MADDNKSSKMDLEEEADHLMHILPSVGYAEILTDLMRCRDATRAERCRIIVDKFSQRILKPNILNKDAYTQSIKVDLLHLEWFFPDVSIPKILFFLETLGPVPNRRLIVAKLLMGKPQSERKRRYLENGDEENPEVSSSKINKTDTDKANAENHQDIPEMIDDDDDDGDDDDWDISHDGTDNQRQNASAYPYPEARIPNRTTTVAIEPPPELLQMANSRPLPEENTITPKKPNVIEIEDSPITNGPLTRQNVDDLIEIFDSPDILGPVPGPSYASVPRVFVKDNSLNHHPGPSHAPRTLDLSNHQPGPSRASVPPRHCQNYHQLVPSNARALPRYCQNNKTTFFVDNSLHYHPGPSDAPVPPPRFSARAKIISSTHASSQPPDNSSLHQPRPSNATVPSRIIFQDASLDPQPGPSDNDEFPPLDCMFPQGPYPPIPSTVTPCLVGQGTPSNSGAGPPQAHTVATNLWRRNVPFDSGDDEDDDENEALNFPPMDSVEIKTDENVVEKPESTVPMESDSKDLVVDEKLVGKLMEVFPHVLSEYLRKICAGKKWSEATFEQLMDTILNVDNLPTRPERPVSPEKEIDPQEQLATLKSLFPDADPTYLQQRVDQFIGNQEAMTAFIENAMDKKDYPTMKDYLRQQQLSAQHKQYTSEFNVERFVELFPDPVAFFEDSKRKTNFGTYDKYYVKWFFRQKYIQLYVKDINYAVDCTQHTNVYAMVKYLEKRLIDGFKKSVKGASNNMSRPDIQNIPLLQELAYFNHKEEILKYLQEKKDQAAKDRLEAKTKGIMQTCSCCFDDEVMPLDTFTCSLGCMFCRDCIKRSTEVAFGDGKINFPCLSSGCESEFSLQILQTVLDPKLFSKIAQKKAVAEVKAAGLEDLESCPFCEFANIPAPEDKVFRCLNPDCMKESCRLCKEPSHLPLRCDEVEKDEAVKARTFIENKMAEALIRECWKCGAKFIKEEGCNKMTCSCGAMMCYVCRQPVKNYKHFNGQGGDQFNLCPLYSDNVLTNEKNVLQAGIEAKKQVDPAQLKTDPTDDVQVYADKIKKAEMKAQQYQQRIAQVHVRRPDGHYHDGHHHHHHYDGHQRPRYNNPHQVAQRAGLVPPGVHDEEIPLAVRQAQIQADLLRHAMRQVQARQAQRRPRQRLYEQYRERDRN